MGEQVDTLEITTVASCSVRCAICPQDALKAAYPRGGPHRLTLDNFKRAISTVPRHVRIHFSGLVEPWLNPDCTAMLRHVLGQGYRVAVYTTCARMLNPEAVAEALIAHRDAIDVICIHAADPQGNMAPDPDASRSRRVLADALRSAGVPYEWMTMDVDRGFEPIDRAGLVQLGRAPTRHAGPITCSYSDTYTHNVMLPNGDVQLCCMDYGLKHRIGNLFTQRWDELDRSDVARDNANQDGTTICRKCHGSRSTS